MIEARRATRDERKRYLSIMIALAAITTGGGILFWQGRIAPYSAEREFYGPRTPTSSWKEAEFQGLYLESAELVPTKYKFNGRRFTIADAWFEATYRFANYHDILLVREQLPSVRLCVRIVGTGEDWWMAPFWLSSNKGWFTYVMRGDRSIHWVELDSDELAGLRMKVSDERGRILQTFELQGR